MSKDYEVAIRETEENELMKDVKDLFDSIDVVELTWNKIYRIHGAISGTLNRHQMLVRETVKSEVDA